jgi:uridine monophosphate synthetase
LIWLTRLDGTQLLVNDEQITFVELAGETVVLIDDLATTGGSKFEAIDKLKAAGLEVRDVVVLIDRESGARESLEAAGYHLHAVVTITRLLDYYGAAGKLSADTIKASREFLKRAL